MIRASAVLGLVALTACGGGADNCVEVEMAPNIIQLSFLRVEPPTNLGTCRVTGQIARVFAGGMERGSDIALDLPCTGAAQATLDAASVLELHLDNRNRLYSYAPFDRLLRNVHALNEATREPVTPVVEEICNAV